MTDEEFEQIPKYTCQDCKCETTAIVTSKGSSIRGVIFKNKELCLTCADNYHIEPKNCERRVTYQHEDTGNIFTKLIPANEPIPEIPRRFIVSVEDV